MRWVALTAVGLLLLGGMISAPIDVVLLGGALLVSRPGVRRLLRRFPVALLLLGQLPWLVRLAIGVAVAWLASTVLTLLLTGPAFGSERLPDRGRHGGLDPGAGAAAGGGRRRPTT